MERTVNLNVTAYMPQILPDLYTAGPFVCLAVASCVDMGVGGANICYLTQINVQTETSGAVQGKKKKFWFLQQASEKEVTKSVLGQLRKRSCK